MSLATIVKESALSLLPGTLFPKAYRILRATRLDYGQPGRAISAYLAFGTEAVPAMYAFGLTRAGTNEIAKGNNNLGTILTAAGIGAYALQKMGFYALAGLAIKKGTAKK